VADRSSILARYNSVRQTTRAICAPLRTEDYVVQPNADVSPPRWHIAHTTWFLEQFLLSRFVPGYQPYHPQYAFLFNSYYNLVGDRTERPRRGLLTRPTVDELWGYREEIDGRMRRLIESFDDPELAPMLELALNHEQQHQELLLTDIKNILFQEPLYPEYQPPGSFTPAKGARLEGWTKLDGGTVEVGHDGKSFAFDNEWPRHNQLLRPCRLANDLVSNGDYLKFIRDGGYTNTAFWLSDGWDVLNQRGWDAPMYWLRREKGWQTFTLQGLRDLNPIEPVTHVSYYEADAFCRWSGKRLPTEFEWEHAAVNGLERTGQLWEWTASAYLPYPGYRAPEGAIGEYNGKFMVNQMVLRGGSLATPKGHIRPTYRNFYHPDKRWQFTGIRLAEGA
jgi:ergothioneine biosynthesis protein EgtB